MTADFSRYNELFSLDRVRHWGYCVDSHTDGSKLQKVMDYRKGSPSSGEWDNQDRRMAVSPAETTSGVLWAVLDIDDIMYADAPEIVDVGGVRSHSGSGKIHHYFFFTEPVPQTMAHRYLIHVAHRYKTTKADFRPTYSSNASLIILPRLTDEQIELWESSRTSIETLWEKLFYGSPQTPLCALALLNNPPGRGESDAVLFRGFGGLGTRLEESVSAEIVSAGLSKCLRGTTFNCNKVKEIGYCVGEMCPLASGDRDPAKLGDAPQRDTVVPGIGMIRSVVRIPTDSSGNYRYELSLSHNGEHRELVVSSSQLASRLGFWARVSHLFPGVAFEGLNKEGHENFVHYIISSAKERPMEFALSPAGIAHYELTQYVYTAVKVLEKEHWLNGVWLESLGEDKCRAHFRLADVVAWASEMGKASKFTQDAVDELYRRGYIQQYQDHHTMYVVDKVRTNVDLGLQT